MPYDRFCFGLISDLIVSSFYFLFLLTLLAILRLRMATYADLPVEVRDIILDSLSWEDLVNYCLSGRFCYDHAQTCFPLWRRITAFAQQRLTDSAYDLRLDTTVSVLREAVLRLMGDFRLSISSLASHTEGPPSSLRRFHYNVVLMGSDLPRNLVALYFSDHTISIYSVAHLATDPPLRRFRVNGSWVLRGLHLCDGNLVLEVAYGMDGMHTRSRKALRFGTLDGNFYGGAIPPATVLNQVVVNEDFVVGLADYVWVQDGSGQVSGWQEVFVIPRVQGRYDGARVVTQYTAGIADLALDSTTLGVVTIHRSRVHHFFFDVVLIAYGLGQPTDVLLEDHIFDNELGRVEYKLNNFLLEIYSYRLIVAHRLSSYYDAPRGAFGGFNGYLQLFNFVYSKSRYGDLYRMDWIHRLEQLEIYYVADGSNSLVTTFPCNYLNVALPGPHYGDIKCFFVGHNFVNFVSDSVFIRRLPVRRITRSRLGRD